MRWEVAGEASTTIKRTRRKEDCLIEVVYRIFMMSESESDREHMDTLETAHILVGIVNCYPKAAEDITG